MKMLAAVTKINQETSPLGSLGRVYSIHSSPWMSRAGQSWAEKHTVPTLQPASYFPGTRVYDDGNKHVLEKWMILKVCAAAVTLGRGTKKYQE